MRSVVLGVFLHSEGEREVVETKTRPAEDKSWGRRAEPPEDEQMPERPRLWLPWRRSRET